MSKFRGFNWKTTVAKESFLVEALQRSVSVCIRVENLIASHLRDAIRGHWICARKDNNTSGLTYFGVGLAVI